LRDKGQAQLHLKSNAPRSREWGPVQSIEADEGRRKQLVWAIERKLAEDGVRPIIFYTRVGSCWHPYVKGITLMVNSIFNSWRMEDVWLDR
jgi:peptide/nickel transport system substrate-binding protein